MFEVNSDDYIPLIAVVVVSIAFVILLATLTNAADVLNSSSINSNGFPVNTTAKPATANATAKPATANATAKLATANERNKTVIAAPPGSTTTTLTTDNKTIISNTSRTGFGGKTFPITIHGGKLVGILADENRASMILVLDPRNMTIELPRIVIDR
ncbi:MAG: hypothetical protein WB988_26035 [Candidatus Nitrosopolaris sp.]